MELAERVDPEEWHRLLDRLFRILAGGVHRYESGRTRTTGGIALTEQTARLAAAFFDFLDRGEQSLKGASVPVRVFELRGPGPDPGPPRALPGARLLALRRPRARACAAGEGSARDAIRSTQSGPGYRGTRHGKEPPLSRVCRARPRRCGPSLCPRALPRTHASLSRDGRAGAQSLRCRRRRVTFGRPGRSETWSRERAARSHCPGFLARPSGGVAASARISCFICVSPLQ